MFKVVDDAVFAAIKKGDKLLQAYLKDVFTLAPGQAPHQLKF